MVALSGPGGAKESGARKAVFPGCWTFHYRKGPLVTKDPPAGARVTQRPATLCLSWKLGYTVSKLVALVVFLLCGNCCKLPKKKTQKKWGLKKQLLILSHL
jgi:hypothetical protein